MESQVLINNNLLKYHYSLLNLYTIYLKQDSNHSVLFQLNLRVGSLGMIKVRIIDQSKIVILDHGASKELMNPCPE